MKKLLFILLFVTLSKICYPKPFLYADDPDKEKIEIVERPTTEPKNDRSVSMVECVFDRSSMLIDVEYSGIGAPVVYILDVNDNIIYYSANKISNHISIPLSLSEGYYRILVQSNSYCGEGVIVIY